MNKHHSKFMGYLLILLLLYCFNLNTIAQISISTGGGLNVAKVTGCNGEFRFGYQLGGYVNYTLQPTFTLYTGLVLNNKGTDNFANTINASVNSLYLDIPIMATYTLKLRDNAILTMGTGPYFSYGIGGTTRIEQQRLVLDSDQTEYKGEIVEYSTFSKNALKRFDTGLGFDIGIQHNSVWLGIRSQFGVLNLSNINDYKLHNQSYALTFAYRFYKR